MRQIYAYSSGLDPVALNTALAGNHVGCVRRQDVGTQQVIVEFLPNSTSGEQSAVQTICTGSPYNLALSSTVADNTYPHLQGDAIAWSPTDLPGLVTRLSAGYLVHMQEESQPTSPSGTQPANDGDLVGQFDDPSPGVRIIQALSDGARPALGTTSGQSHLVFGGSQSMAVAHSDDSGIYNYVTAGIFSFLWNIRFDTDGAATYLLDNTTTGSAAQAGINIVRGTNNRLSILLARSGTTVVNYSPTQTMVNADGFQTLAIWGDNTNIYVKWGANATQQTAFTGARGALQPTGLLTLCALSSGGTAPTHCSIREFAMTNQVVGADDLTRFTAYVTRRNTQSMLRLSERAFYNYCMHWLDFTDISTLAQHTDGTVPVTTTGQPIGYVSNKADRLGGTIGRHLANIAGNMPTYQGANVGAQFDGTSSNQFSTLHPIAEKNCTWICVARNTDTNGSDVVSDGTGSTFYMRMNGASASSNPNTFLGSFTGGSYNPVPLHDTSGGYNVLEHRKLGPSALTGRCSYGSATSQTAELNFSFDNVGINASGDRAMTGFQMHQLLYNAYLPDFALLNFKGHLQRTQPSISLGPN